MTHKKFVTQGCFGTPYDVFSAFRRSAGTPYEVFFAFRRSGTRFFSSFAFRPFRTFFLKFAFRPFLIFLKIWVPAFRPFRIFSKIWVPVVPNIYESMGSGVPEPERVPLRFGFGSENIPVVTHKNMIHKKYDPQKYEPFLFCV